MICLMKINLSIVCYRTSSDLYSSRNVSYEDLLVNRSEMYMICIKHCRFFLLMHDNLTLFERSSSLPHEASLLIKPKLPEYNEGERQYGIKGFDPISNLIFSCSLTVIEEVNWRFLDAA